MSARSGLIMPRAKRGLGFKRLRLIKRARRIVFILTRDGKFENVDASEILNETEDDIGEDDAKEPKDGHGKGRAGGGSFFRVTGRSKVLEGSV